MSEEENYEEDEMGVERKKHQHPIVALDWQVVEVFDTEEDVDTYFRYRQDFKTVASHGNENPRCRLCDDYRIKHVSYFSVIFMKKIKTTTLGHI
jgi:hypothetical protein